MKAHVRSEYDKAVQLKSLGRLEDALRILNELHVQEPCEPAILAVSGDVLWSLGRHGEAVEHFDRAILLRPCLEAVSLGKFHCLLESGRKDEALAEMDRFLSLGIPSEYDALDSEAIRKAAAFSPWML